MKRVLIIEDTAEIRENVTELLELRQYRIFAAQDGAEGLQLALEHQPDVIVCDVKMPVMNGFELLEALRENKITSGIPFIFISASAQGADIQKGKMSGASAYLTKPFKFDDLIQIIEQVS